MYLFNDIWFKVPIKPDLNEDDDKNDSPYFDDHFQKFQISFKIVKK